MRYISTRGGGTPQRFTDILLEGLAPDGGLYLPESYPQISSAELAEWRSLDYRGLAFEILSRFVDDIPRADLKGIIERAYTAKAFGSDNITPLKQLEPGLYLLQLSNGPTLAFKDVALQLLGELFEYELGRRGETLNVLGATSGDTGSAAEYAMRGKKNVRVFMLSPYGRMSPFQAAQMYSLADPNIFNIGVRGLFDDCQDLVKGVSADLQFKAAHRIGTVNSINWARLLAQVVYYFKGYLEATGTEAGTEAGAEAAAGSNAGHPATVSFSVPTGNFGDIAAGHIARQMGLPIRKLIVATNENNVLDEFFRTGIYRARKADEVFQTSSPSMDISKASNFERYVYDLVGRDPLRVGELWGKLDGAGQFDLSGSPSFARVGETGFVSGYSTHAERLDTIRMAYARYRYIIDTHTADGVRVGLKFREPGVPLVCLETAQAVKFEATIREALGRDPDRPPGFKGIEGLPQRCEIMDPDLAAVKRFIEQRT
ncbi:MAG: threonine synthase [Betaproteobacteria bacterium]|nr:threonine synthase [Betaproteobacteria bacterium]